TPQFQAEPCRSTKVAPIVEHVHLCYAYNLMRGLIFLTAPRMILFLVKTTTVGPESNASWVKFSIAG
ncbi:hypothetical protein, partial [Planktomarina sp.]|uniref:hypothetical protein n=1 Tax=Planktomarina sp. TaxID=2024851 RepID=UPI00325FF134